MKKIQFEILIYEFLNFSTAAAISTDTLWRILKIQKRVQNNKWSARAKINSIIV